jgi:quinol monooxygenase YgiN
LDLTHYEDVAGFLDKPGDMKECGVFYDTRITCANGKRDQVLAGLTKVASHVEREEPGTYTFLVLRSLDTEDGARVFERYESRAKMEEHWKGKALLEFFTANKEQIKSMEGRSYVPNGYGWLHR